MGDILVNTEVLLPGEDGKQLAKVIRRSVDDSGNLVGNWNENPILNTVLYDVEFPDGAIKSYGANVVAENILNTVGEDGIFSQFLEGIVGHRHNKKALTNKERYFLTRRGSNMRLLQLWAEIFKSSSRMELLHGNHSN